MLSFLVIVIVVAILMLCPGWVFAAEKGGDLPIVKWRCQSAWPPPEQIVSGSKYKGGYGMVVEVARKVKERTNGKFIIEVFTPN